MTTTSGSGHEDPFTGSRVRPSTAGTIHDHPSSVHQFTPSTCPEHEVPSFPTLTSSSHPGGPSFHQPQNHQAAITPYSDELSFHTSSYTGSYDSSYANSPWPFDDQHQHRPPIGYYPIGAMTRPSYRSSSSEYGPYKQDEPVLAPGEMPAPRPPMSYAALIGEALLLAPPPHALYVSEISDSVRRRYACE